MQSSIYFTACCLIFTTILLIAYFSKKRIKTSENAIFSGISIITFISLCLEIANYFLIRSGFDEKNLFFIFCSKLILISFYIWGSLFSMYINVSANKESTNRLYKYLIPTLSLIILILPISYLKKNGMVIPSGLSVLFLYLVLGFIIILSLIKMLSFKKRDIKKFYPLMLFIILTMISTVTQFFNPTILFSDLIFPVILFVMFFTIENPDLKMIQQLELAREEADKANRSKTDFLSSMSHEIRTPLNAIVGFSDCILEAKNVDEAKENAKDIISASQTLLEIVNGILDISKIEAGKMEIVNKKYNAKQIFYDLAKLITPRMQDKGLDFTYEIDPNLPAMLYGDSANIKKIVTNFLSNACKYTDHGFVRYEVHSVNLGEYSRIIISVEDSGRGIKKEAIDKMFTRFQRLEEDRNTTIEGTGLGLAITKQLAELMGGKVIVHTIYGKGSKFTVVLNQKIEQMDMKEKVAFTEHLDLTDVKILIVDDAPLNLKVAVKLFEKYQANHIDTCSSGFECIDKIRSGEQYDLIFLDDMMPKMSGVETYHELQKYPNFHVPIVALTANAITGMREKYLSEGFQDYLAKPIEQTELIRVCNRLLGREYTTTSMDPVKEENVEEKNKVIPVETNIEELVSQYVELTDSGEEFPTTISTMPQEIPTTEPVSNQADILPVVDLNLPSTTPSTTAPTEVYDRDYLANNGVDFDKALELLGDMDMYDMTIQDFLAEVEDKWNRMKEYLATHNMEDYAVDVHSLKSDCKYLGFMHLAEIAYDHELHSKNNDVEYIKDHYSELETEYNRVLSVVKNYASQLKKES